MKWQVYQLGGGAHDAVWRDHHYDPDLVEQAVDHRETGAVEVCDEAEVNDQSRGGQLAQGVAELGGVGGVDVAVDLDGRHRAAGACGRADWP